MIINICKHWSKIFSPFFTEMYWNMENKKLNLWLRILRWEEWDGLFLIY